MKRIIISFLLLAWVTICIGQTTEIKYYNNKRLDKEVPEGKAKFSRTIIETTDGLHTVEIRNIKNKEIIKRWAFKGEERYGIWIKENGKGLITLDYNFPLIYSDDECRESVNIIRYDKDIDSLGYKAPIMKGEKTFYQTLFENIEYPNRAKELNIEGTVYLKVTLKDDGSIDYVVVKRGVDISLDKEAARVARLLDFKSPPTLNGKVLTCFILPVKYRLM